MWRSKHVGNQEVASIDPSHICEVKLSLIITARQQGYEVAQTGHRLLVTDAWY